YVDHADCIAKATICKVLIKFPQIIGPDPAQIPANSTIARATLDLTVLNAGVKQDLYQVTEAWNESTATWNGFATPGQPTTRAREYTFYPTALGKMSLDLTSIVQRWANGDSNQGILLASTHWDGVDYGSSEATTKPTLTAACGGHVRGGHPRIGRDSLADRELHPQCLSPTGPSAGIRLHDVHRPAVRFRCTRRSRQRDRDRDDPIRIHGRRAVLVCQPS